MDCPTSCSACGENCCPCNYNGPTKCILQSPRKPAIFKNAVGVTVPDCINKWILKAHANKFLNNQASAAAAEHELTYAEKADYRDLTYKTNSANCDFGHGVLHENFT